MRLLGCTCAIVIAVSVSSAANAQEETVPDLEFLEYLGSWTEEEDEEWFVDAEIREELEEGDNRRKRRKREDDE